MMGAEIGWAGVCPPDRSSTRKADAMPGRLARAGRRVMASGVVAALVLLTTALAGPALGQAVKPVWSDNEDGRANLFLGPQPDYAKSLGVEYATGRTTKALKRGDVDGMPSSVWVTDTLGEGTKDLRWRWVVDGTPQKWSGTSNVTVTQKPLFKANKIDAFGDGSVTLTLDRTYEVGQFEDGEWYAVAPQGLKITQATPVQKGSGKSLRNGASVDLDFLDQGLDGRGQGFDQANVTGLNETIKPGSVLVKAMSEDGKRNAYIDRMATLTVLSERPPAGSFRPTVYENGGRALRNEAEIDLDRVPRIDYDPRSFPSLDRIQDWRVEQLTRPAPPLGGGSTGARQLYPEDQAVVLSPHATAGPDAAGALHHGLEPHGRRRAHGLGKGAGPARDRHSRLLRLEAGDRGHRILSLQLGDADRLRRDAAARSEDARRQFARAGAGRLQLRPPGPLEVQLLGRQRGVRRPFGRREEGRPHYEVPRPRTKRATT